MTDWIEHTTDTCPVDPETVVEVRLRGGYVRPADKAGDMDWGSFWVASFRPPLGSPVLHPLDVTHYRIITPAKPPEPEMVKSDWIKFTMSDGRPARYRVTAVGPNGAVPPTDDAPEVTFKYPLLEDPEPDMTRRYPDDAELYAESRVRPEMNADAAAALKRQIADAYRAGEDAQALKAKARANPEPDLITLRLECLKLVVMPEITRILSATTTVEQLADRFLHYVLNGSVDKA
jgi:hypothetical protein